MLSEYATIIKTILYGNLVGFLSSVVMSRVTLFKNTFQTNFGFLNKRKDKSRNIRGYDRTIVLYIKFFLSRQYFGIL